MAPNRIVFVSDADLVLHHCDRQPFLARWFRWNNCLWGWLCDWHEAAQLEPPQARPETGSPNGITSVLLVTDPNRLISAADPSDSVSSHGS